MNIIVVGLSITSSWGNGHASTYRSLLAALHNRGHEITFFERDVPWYAAHRDLPATDYARVVLYDSLADLKAQAADPLAWADLVVVGSYVPEGPAVIDFVQAEAAGLTAFYDIDTPITMAKLAAGDDEYLKADQVERFDLYLSFSGGPVLGELERAHGAVRARALYCSVDTDTYHPVPDMPRWHLGYLGTYSPDRQPGLEVRLLNAARSWPGGRFVVAGAQFPASIPWPANVERIDHVAPAEHAAFFAAQRFTLNLTRDAMCRRGYSPSVRLFEAAACGVPIISDTWPGLDTFFVPGREIFVSTSTNDTLTYLRQIDDDVRRRVADAARRRVLQEHSASQRARELEGYVAECLR